MSNIDHVRNACRSFSAADDHAIQAALRCYTSAGLDVGEYAGHLNELLSFPAAGRAIRAPMLD